MQAQPANPAPFQRTIPQAAQNTLGNPPVHNQRATAHWAQQDANEHNDMEMRYAQPDEHYGPTYAQNDAVNYPHDGMEYAYDECDPQRDYDDWREDHEAYWIDAPGFPHSDAADARHVAISLDPTHLETCRQCGTEFVSRNALFKHLQEIHGVRRTI
ncbi:hypothetical protein BHE90_010122 [Fusarium euwallaceae]|uniref:C2H2-type domain-containing protein n=1 Tax=Fusarium euwallaceae TaxID=1147111 RepID=A0A430LIA1_9HYPO|nr:hypothetical protein BHE90_010122 [Fusarium euwallaceae]